MLNGPNKHDEWSGQIAKAKLFTTIDEDLHTLTQTHTHTINRDSKLFCPDSHFS